MQSLKVYFSHACNSVSKRMNPPSNYTQQIASMMDWKLLLVFTQQCTLLKMSFALCTHVSATKITKSLCFYSQLDKLVTRLSWFFEWKCATLSRTAFYFVLNCETASRNVYKLSNKLKTFDFTTLNMVCIQRQNIHNINFI